MSEEKGVKERKDLIVGGDDSNHAGTAEGEIIIATFSFFPEDSLVKRFPNNRDYKFVTDWLNSSERDFRFALLTSEKYRHSSENLIEIIPSLIFSYMEEENVFTENLKIYLDGRLSSGNREEIRNKFRNYRGIENVIVDNFIKKRFNERGKIIKRPECPTVTYCADVLANYLYSTTFERTNNAILRKLSFRE